MKTFPFYVLIFLLSLPVLAQDKAVEVIYAKAYKNFRDSSDNAPRLLKNYKFRLFCNPVASRFEKIRSTMVGSDNTIWYKVDEFSRFPVQGQWL